MALAPAFGLGDSLLAGKSWASPVPGNTFYVFPAWNADTHGYDPSLQIPAGSSTVTMADLQAGYYGTFAQAWARSQTGVGGFDNDPTSATFNPDPSIEGYSVAYWVMNGAPVATAQTYAARWAAKLNRSVLKLSDLGPIGPGDPLYAKLQAQNALNLVTLATQPAPATGNVVDTTYATPAGQALPVNQPTVQPSVQTVPDASQGTAADGTPTIASVAQSTSTNPPATAGFSGIAAVAIGAGLLLALTRKKKK